MRRRVVVRLLLYLRLIYLRLAMESKVCVMTMRVSMVVIMPMRRRCIRGLFESALFSYFFGLSDGIVKLVAATRCMRGKTFDRILIHVAGQRDLRMLHAQGAWIT